MIRKLILIPACLIFVLSSYAQEHIEKRYSIYFRVNRTDIDRNYMDNGRTIQTMVDDITTTLKEDGSVPDSLLIYASTSPEGSLALNEQLALQRANTSRNLLVGLFPQFKADNIKVESRVNDWSGVILTLRRDQSIVHRNAIFNVLNDPRIINKDAALRAMPDAYAEIRDGMFNYMRTATITISVIGAVDEFVTEPEIFITSESPVNFGSDGGNGMVTFEKNVNDNVVPAVSCSADWIEAIVPGTDGISFKVNPNEFTESRSAKLDINCYGKDYEVVVNQEASDPPVVVVEPEPEPEPAPEPEPEPESVLKPWYMVAKTNMIYDLAAVPNVGLEFYLGKNLSVAGNWMYSWWKSDPKSWYWRTYGGDLALRYWFGKASKQKPLTGHHVGLYCQMLTYDFELGGRGYLGDKWSYGAGVEYGYSLPVAKRLNIDFNLGAGYLTGEFKEYLPIDGHYVWQVTKNRQWFGPTKLEIALTWLLGRGNINEGKGGKR